MTALTVCKKSLYTFILDYIQMSINLYSSLGKSDSIIE